MNLIFADCMDKKTTMWQHNYCLYWLILLFYWTTNSLVAQDYSAPLPYSRPTTTYSMKNSDQNLTAELIKIQETLQKLNKAFQSNLNGIRQNKKMVVELGLTLDAYKKQVKELQGYNMEFPKPSFSELEKCLAAVNKAKAKKQAQNNSTEQEDIDCSNFTNAVLQWRTEIELFFEDNRKHYGDVVIDVKAFAARMARYRTNLPIVASLYEEWQQLLSGLEEELTGAKLFDHLLNNAGSTWQLTNNTTALEAHYKQNRKAYKKHESTLKDFKEEAMPKPQYFLDALAAASSEHDPNLPENKEEHAEEHKEEIKRWEQDYKNWLNETITKLSNIDSTEEGKVMNKNMLSNKRDNKLKASTYAQEFWEATGKAVEQAIIQEQGTVSYEKAVEIAIEILKQKRDEYINEAFLEAAIASGTADLPIGLEDWLRACTNDNEILYGQFLEQWQAWSQEASNMVAVCENQRAGQAYTIDSKTLAAKMQQVFGYTVNGATPGVEIWKELQSHLPTKPTTNFETLHTAWQNGMIQVQQESFARNMWNQYLTSGQEQQPIEQAMSSFFIKLPSQERLINTLLDARYHAPQPVKRMLQQPTNSDTIQATVVIRWQPVPVLMGEAAAQIAEELGLDSVAALISKAVGVSSIIDSSRGVENLVVRLSDPLRMTVTIPMKLIESKQQGGIPLVVPSSPDSNCIMFTGIMDTYYKVEVKRLYTDRPEPIQTGNNRFEQRLFITLELEGPAITVGVSASFGVGANVEVAKNPKKYSLEIELVIESSYDEANNRFGVEFSRTNRDLVDYSNNGIVERMTIPETLPLQLEVYK